MNISIKHNNLTGVICSKLFVVDKHLVGLCYANDPRVDGAAQQ